MSKLTKTFLALCLLASIVGFTPATSSLAWGLFKPLGAVFFILFFIFRLLENDCAQLDGKRSDTETLRKSGRAPSNDTPTPSHGRNSTPLSAH